MRRVWLTAGVWVFGAALQLTVGATSASAAMQCRAYDGIEIDGVRRAGTVCAAPADDYPAYRGIATVGRVDLWHPCSGLFPSDIDEPVYRGCPEHLPGYNAWVWSANGWVWKQVGFGRGRVAMNPFVPGWRWAYNRHNGWFAVPSRDAWIRWLSPRGGGTSIAF